MQSVAANTPPADAEPVEESVLSDPKFAACLERLEAHFPKAKIKTPRLSFQRLGRFEIRRELGRGRFGVVFLAWDPQLQRQVALKVPQFDAAMDPDLRERFRGEALSAGKLQHPGIVSIYDVGQHAGVDYLAMAYVDGQTLADRLQDGPLPPQEAALLLIKLAQAVQHAHEEGVIHRDLKPSNVLLDKAHQPHVTDFGLARRLSDSAMRATATGQVLGTPAYMPPEQAAGQSDIGATSDVYSLGVILYETITGRPPFQAATFVEAVEFILNRDPLPPSKLNPKLPRELDAITFKCLEKRPAARYQSAAELADDLQRYLDGRPIHARSQGFLQHAIRWARRHPSQALLSLATIVLIALGVATGIVYNRWQHADALAAEQQSTAETQRYFAKINKARHIIGRRQPGWSTAALSELQMAAAIRSVSADRHELRQLATECLTGFDLQREVTLDTGMYIGRIDTSPSGKLLAVGELKGNTSCRVVIYDLATREVRHKFTILNEGLKRVLTGQAIWQDGVREFAFSSDERYLAVGLRFGSIYCYDLQYPDRPPRCLVVSGEREMERIAFSRDGKSLFAQAKDYEFLRWQDWANDTANDVPFPGRPRCFAVPAFADAMYIVHRDEAFSMMNQQLKPREYYSPSAKLPQVAFSDMATDGSGQLIAGATDHGLSVYETVGGALIRNLQDDTVGNEGAADFLSFSSDGRLLMGFEDTGIVRIFDVVRGRQVMRLDLPRHDCQHVALDPASRWLVVANDKKLDFWRISGGPVHQVLTSPAECVEDIGISPAGDKVACISLAGLIAGPRRTTVSVFDNQTARLLDERHGGHEHLHWSLDDAQLDWSGSDLFVACVMGTERWRCSDAGSLTSQGFVPLTGPTTPVNYEVLDEPAAEQAAAIENVPHPRDAKRNVLRIAPNGQTVRLRCRLESPVQTESQTGMVSISLKIDAAPSYAAPAEFQTDLPHSAPHRAPIWTWAKSRDGFHRWTIDLPFKAMKLSEFTLFIYPKPGLNSVEIERIDYLALGMRKNPNGTWTSKQISQLAVAPPGQRIWGRTDEEIRSWRLPAGDQPTTWKNSNHRVTGAGNIRALVVGKRGTLVGTRDGRVHWLDPVAGQSINSWSGPGEEVVALKLCEPVNLALVGDETGQVRGLQIPDGKVLFDLPADESAIVALTATPNGKTLITASSNRMLKLWRREPGGSQASYELYCQLPDTVSQVWQLDISDDGNYLAILAKRTMHAELWNLPKLTQELQRLGVE
jgi:WD40 repeat protein